MQSLDLLVLTGIEQKVNATFRTCPIPQVHGGELIRLGKSMPKLQVCPDRRMV
jgi:hypothetical protein